jgi:hypothetical protein
MNTSSFILNILPELFADYTDLLQLDGCSLSVSVTCKELEQLGISVPLTDWQISQPYPNGRYYTAGHDRKMGWNIAIPESLRNITVEMLWTFLQENYDDIYIHHSVKVNLNPTDAGNAYGFSQTHPSGGSNARIASVLTEKPETIKSFQERGNYFYEDKDGIISIHQEVTLDSMDQDRFQRYYDKWEDVVLLRDREPAKTFNTFVEQHRKNACCEMPVEIFLDAWKQARIDEDNSLFDKSGNYEDHPAVKTICNWWREHTPSPHKEAGCFEVWVRVEDDEDYWNAWHETPSRLIASFDGDELCNARIGDHILIEFLAKKSEFAVISRNDTMVKTVDGADYFDIGLSLEETSEAWYSYKLLLDFPESFPVAWDELHRLSLASAL